MNRGTFAIIPARGGSKRVPRKNIRPFGGKPMIAWPIQAALESGGFEEVIVSTDDPEIAVIAREHGATVPFVRPAELSGDEGGLTDVVRHLIGWLREQERDPRIVACLYATAAFLRADDLRQGLRDLAGHPETDYVLGVTSFPAPVERAITTGADGHLEFIWPEFAQARSQDTRQAYHDAGHFFMGRAEAFMKYPTTMSGKTRPCVIPRLLCQDIDTPEDWEHAAELFDFLQTRKGGGHR